jgi:hypothetical protein
MKSECKNWITTKQMHFALFWYITPCSPYVNRRFGGIYRLHLQVGNQPREEPACSRSSYFGFQTCILPFDFCFP